MKEAYLLAQQVNQFYLEAFNHALVVVGIVFGVVGVVVPAGIAYFQARQARNELEQLKRQLSSEMTQAIADAVLAEKEVMLREQALALTSFQERSDKVIADLRDEIRRESGALRGSSFHVQALASVNANHSAFAVTSACNAIPHYLLGKDFGNLRTVCAHIALVELRKTNGDSLGRHKDKLVESCEAALKAMREGNVEGNLSDLIRDLRYELDECLRRTTPPEE
jgi:type II secretory pathway pseudopilin PulG